MFLQQSVKLPHLNDNGTIAVNNDQVRLNEKIHHQIRFDQMKNTIFLNRDTILRDLSITKINDDEEKVWIDAEQMKQKRS